MPRKSASGLAALALLLFVAGPIVWLALHAFATEWRVPNLLPAGLTFDWWGKVFGTPKFVTSILNSLMFAVLSTTLTALICMPAAYAFGRMQFPGRTVMLLGLFATNAFPKMGLFVSIAALYYAFNLMETIPGVTIAHMLGQVVFLTWIPAASFAAVPRRLEDAARDSGAGWLRTFVSVTLPLAAPGYFVALIMAFLASWDEAQATYLVGAPSYSTMPTELYTLVLNSPEQVAAVFSIMLTVPSVVLLLLVRRHIMGGALAEGFQIR